MKILTRGNEIIKRLIDIAEEASKLPFGESQALPWCREPFAKLDSLLSYYEDNKEEFLNLYKL